MTLRHGYRQKIQAYGFLGPARLGAIVRTLLSLSVPALARAGLYTFLLAEFVAEWNLIIAFSVASAPLAIPFIFLQRYVVHGMTAGAIKS